MKKLFIQLIIFFLTITVYGQEKGIEISFMGGLSQPMGDYKTEEVSDITEEPIGFPIDFIGDDKERRGPFFYNMDVNYSLGELGIGMSLGGFNHEVSDFSYHQPFKTELAGGKLSGFYYGVGPNYKLKLSKIQFALMLRAGMANYKYDGFKAFYAEDDVPSPVEILDTQLTKEAKTNQPYGSFAIKLSYPIAKKINVFAKFDYLTTLGKGLEVNDTYYLPFDMDADGKITASDVGHFTLPDFKREDTRFIKPQMLNIGVGLSYTFGVKIKKNKQVKNTSMVKNIDEEEKEQETKIILTYPENNSQFSEGKTFKDFKWKIVGKEFTNPKYIIEVRPLNKRKGTLIAFSPKENVNFKQVFKDVSPEGLYSWRVVEQNSGTTSTIRTIAFTNCDVHMSVNNVEVECLGYEGADRKYKICFDVAYDSPTGDLTYNNAGSGLTVYDQAYSALAYNLVSPNTTLATQVGANNTTVHYCFETIVDNNVNTIGFALQGDDLDPSPVECKPGASNGVEELPSCLCDDCDQITIDFNENSITQTNDPSVFTFDGTVNVNQPIYGIEFQMVSLNYSSSPSACSNGITRVEESGMFLQAGTTINNSTSIQFNNENASQDPNSNSNASKNIKYSSNGALNGNTPFSLSIGLPQPLQGLNTGCCQIDYEVCIKANVLYEDGTCKTCTITKCFNFNNQ